MNDKELTRLAYKAAFSGADLSLDRDMEKHWRPLTDDGDALRLAVKLRIAVEYTFGGVEVSASWRVNKIFAGNVVEEIGSLRNGDEPNAATRRAIVRAAAEIGKAMP